MANTVIGGFRFYKMRNGSGRPVVEQAPVASGYATGIFRGDPLKRLSDGTVDIAAAGENIYGIADGAVRFNGRAIQANSNFLPASTTYTGAPDPSNDNASVVNVILARDAIFEVDCDTAQASITAARSLVGNNADHIAAAGSTSTGRSGYKLDGATFATTAAQWRVMGISDHQIEGTNDVTVTNWKVLVEVNESIEPQFSTSGV